MMNFPSIEEFPTIHDNTLAVRMFAKLTVNKTISSSLSSTKHIDKSEHDVVAFYASEEEREKVYQFWKELCSPSETRVDHPAREFYQTMEKNGDAWVELPEPVLHKEEAKTITTLVENEIEISSITYQKPTNKLSRFIRFWKLGWFGGLHWIDPTSSCGRLLVPLMDQHIYLGSQQTALGIEHVLVNPIIEHGWIKPNVSFVLRW